MSFELKLHTIQILETSTRLFVPDADAIQKAFSIGEIASPYWSQVWPSALALCEFIVAHSHVVQDKKVLELGAGLGLPSLLAARYAFSVLCSDKEADAVEIIARSALENNLSNLQAVVINWEVISFEINVDVVLLSDVNYEPHVFEKLNALILNFINNGTKIILTTPQRLMAKSFIEPLLKFCVQQEEILVKHKNETVPITVLVLGKKR